MLKTLLTLITIISFFQMADAQIPNDNCEGAFSIFIGSSGQSDEVIADLDFAHPSFQGSNECRLGGSILSYGADRWYSFVATGEVSTIIISDQLRISIAVYDGLCGATTHLTCDGAPFQTVIGETYFIRVMHTGVNALADATASFKISSTAEDTNLTCSTALAITEGQYVNFAGNYSDSGYASTCNESTEDLWLSFVAPANGSIDVSTGSGEILSGTCGSLTPFICLPNSPRPIHGLTPGDQYYIRIVNNNFVSGFQYDVSSVVGATNIECSTSLPLTVDGPNVALQFDQSNTGAFWFSFTAPASGSIRYDGLGSAFIWDTYTNDCVSQGKIGDNERSIYGMIPGDTYLVRVEMRSSVSRNFGIESTFVGATNNLCQSATPITVSAMCDGSNAVAGTFIGTNESFPSCSFGDNVYYSFVAPASGSVDISLDNTSYSVKVLGGDCVNYQAVHPRSLTAAETYLIEINRKNSSIQDFTICISERIGTEPNEVCADAIEVFYDSDFMFNGENARTEDIGPSFCTNAVPDLWYKFVATSSACNFTGNIFNQVKVYSSTCGALEEIELSTSGIDRTAAALTIGDTYYLQIFGFDNTTRTISSVSLAPNDECEGAIVITDGSNSSISDAASLSSVALPSCADPAIRWADIWYKYTPATSAINFEVGTGAVVALYQNGCESLTEVACDAENIEQFENLDIGSEYIIRLINRPNRSFSSTITSLELPANAYCAGSIAIPVWEETYQSPTQVNFGLSGVDADTGNCGLLYGRWYDFVSPSSGGVRLIAPSLTQSVNSLSIELYDACDGTLIYCQNLSSDIETETIALAPDQNYKVRLAVTNNFFSSVTPITAALNIRSVPDVPTESSCAEAISISVSEDETCSQSIGGSSNNAASTQGSFCGELSAQAVFYTITADEDANHRIDVSNAAAQHRVSVFSDCNLASPIACGLGSSDVMLMNGTTYIIAVYPETKDVQSSFDLCIYKPTIINTGSVGINTNNPQAKLDVNGGIRPGFTANPLPGVIRWNSDLEVFDGVEWQSAINWDHTATEDVDMTGNRISNLAEPVLPTDAVTKAYVDNRSDEDNSPSNEIQTLSTSGNEVTLSQGGGTISVDVNDADADPSNELQTLFQNSNIVGLSNNGGSVDINDADADPNNEIQTLSQNGNAVSLSNGGGAISVNDGDADDQNELQDLSRSGSTLSLSGSMETISINDGDADDQNELQTISKSGIIVTLSDGGGTVNVGDNDNDATNEIQSISRSGNQLVLTSGGAVSLVDDDGSNTNELQTVTQNGNSVSLSLGGGSFTVDDGDDDDENELQTISKTLNEVTLSDGGGTISIDDGDSDDGNEIQVLSKAGVNISLSNGGGSVNVNDLDSDPQNEIQTTSQAGQLVTLSQGGGSFTVFDGDDNIGNELQTISKSGNNVTLSAGGGTVSVADGDSDDANELVNSLSLSGTTLQVNQNGGNKTINLSPIATPWDNNGTEIYYNSANVGIGASDPTEKLDVRGTAQVRMNSSGSSPQLQLVETSSTDGARINFQSSVETTNTWTLYGRADNTTADNSFNLFHTVSGNILQVKGNGDVGINGVPNADLHLYHGNSGTSDGLKLENTSGTTPWWRIYVSSGSSDLRLFSKSQGTSILGKFDHTNGQYAALSDRRFKKSVEDLHFDWASFMNLDLYSYLLLGDTAQKRSIGIMAQDLINVYPELVYYEEDADQYLVNYSGLGVVAIKAVQEQQKELEQLRAENEDLRKEMSEIKRMLELILEEK